MKRIILSICLLALVGCNKKPVAWEDCNLASCWDGANASRRMMNMLSPHMPDDVFDQYAAWMKDRGCNTAHLILYNKSDGQYAGYTPFGSTYGQGLLDDATVNLMKERIESLLDDSFAIVIWIFTDDSNDWARKFTGRFASDLQQIKDSGLLDQASYVCAGLELNEYWSAGQVAAIIGGIRQVYDGPVAVHQTSDRTDYAPLGDLFLWQTNPGKSPSQIAALVKQVIAKTGKPVSAFEMERQPARELCEAALQAGAWSVGNW